MASNGTIKSLFHKSCKIQTIIRGCSCGRRCSGLVRSSAETNLEGKPCCRVSGREKVASYSKRLALAGGWQYVGLKGWQSGWLAVGSQWQRIGLNWEAELAGHWSPNQTLLTLDCNRSNLFSLLPSETSLTSNWERINVKSIRDSHKQRAIIGILPLDVLWTDGVCLKMQ